MKIAVVIASVAGALFLILKYDWFGSTARFLYYGQQERFKILQDRYGQAEPWKVAVLIAVKMSPFALYLHPWFGWRIALWGPIVALPHLIIGLNNRKNARSNREYQKKIAAAIAVRSEMSDEDLAVWLSTRLDLITRHERHYFKFFRWFTYDSPDTAAAGTAAERSLAKLELTRKIRRWVADGAIFPA